MACSSKAHTPRPRNGVSTQVWTPLGVCVGGLDRFCQSTSIITHAAYLFVVDNGPQFLNEVVSCLVHTHLRQHVAVVVAAGLVRQYVRHRQQRPRAEAALDLDLRDKERGKNSSDESTKRTPTFTVEVFRGN